MKAQQAHVVLLDNHDSFVYNLVDAFAVAGYRCTVLRNSVTVTEVLDLEPALICLSPGPGHPREAGCMMDLIGASIGTIPILGICLGFQALLEHHGGEVRPCGPVHGTTDLMTLTNPDHPLFAGLSIDATPNNNFHGTQVPIARYHSLGCTDIPPNMVSLGTCDSAIGPVTMAAETHDGEEQTTSIGLQFHPESVLSPSGPIILERCVDKLLANK